MKKNGNDKILKQYYVGVDAGTNSVGWAVTDALYNILRCNGKMMWGARLFDEANDAQERRTNRTNRRRLERRKTRLNYLEVIFNNEIVKIDPTFFRRLHESNLVKEDKTDSSEKYLLFNDKDYTDADYLIQYPTAYHLRSELVHSTEPHDIRLVFLAIHHILKSRGHFLYETGETDDEKTFEDSYYELADLLSQNYNCDIASAECDHVKEIMYKSENVTTKKTEMKELFVTDSDNDDCLVDVTSVGELLAGATVQFSKLFKDDELKDAEIKSVSLKDNLDEKYDQISAVLGDRADLIFEAKELFDIATLGKLLGNDAYISDAKIRLYENNRTDLNVLKNFFRNKLSFGEITKDEYDKVFKVIKDKKDKTNNLAAYIGDNPNYSCSQEDFCKFLEKTAKDMAKSEDSEEVRVFNLIKDRTFMTRLKGTENGLLPYQLQLKELKKILANAESYLPFLKEKDANGYTAEQKIISLCTFRIPYYVGPLNTASDKAWVSRTNEKIYPWNFDEIVNKEESADRFMKKLIGRCTYTGDYVLPKQSLLFSSYTVLNEINNIKVNGNPIPVDCKQQIYHDLFEKNNRKITKKSLKSYMIANGFMESNDELSGVDNEIHANLKSYHDFRKILEKTNDPKQVETIIERMLVYGNDKKMLKNWLVKNTHDLDENDISHILRLNYKDWGRLSEKLLNGIYHEDKNGEVFTIMDMLWNTNKNLMKLLSKEYQFAEKAKAYKNETYGLKDSIHDKLDDLYIAPSVRRCIWQTVRILDEIVDIEKGAPEKIFIEMARTSSKEMEKKRTESRKTKLSALYASCKDQAKELSEKLAGETDQSLRRDKLYLYYTQLGRCMYSGEKIDLTKLLNDDTTYDIDHIYPRSKIKDNSLDNRVLVCSKYNRDKTDIYPIKEDIRSKMHDFWSMLYDKKLISAKKYERLIRNKELTNDELSSFVARQLVETQQSTKALATILQEIYPNTTIVYSKAGNVHDFRQEFNIPKFRNVNDLHHAKDAYLNIVVGNVYDTKFTDKFFLNIDKEKYSLNRVFEYSTENAWIAPTKDEMKEYVSSGDSSVLSGTIQTVYKYVYKNNPIVTTALFRQKGALFDLNIMPKHQGQLPIKEGMDIDKYGGYNKRKGTYFCVVEHTEKKKRIRTIQPVYLDKVNEYEKDPAHYCEEVLDLKEPIIVAKCVLFNQILELDGKRVRITGRTGKQLLFKHTYQFAISDSRATYLKNLDKYIARCTVSKKTLEIVPWDHISKEENIEMYDWFIERMNSGVYQKLFKNMQKDMHDNRNKFISMDALQQAKLLLEILKAFKCDRTNPSFKELNGKGTVGVLQYSYVVSNCINVYLINESVTGLYETKINLLGD